MTRPNGTELSRVGPSLALNRKFPLSWGASHPRHRGPVIGTLSRMEYRNAIGTHGGCYSVYRALAVSAGVLDPIRRPDLTNTFPAAEIGPFAQWTDPMRIVTLDPWGHLVAKNFADEIGQGIDIRPTIAVARARLNMPEIRLAIAANRLVPDGTLVHACGSISVTKIAIEPVWYLPGVAKRFGTNETKLREMLFEQTGGMFPQLITQPDIDVFLPPIGGTTVYLFGDVSKLALSDTKVTCRVHDECNGSDVFGSDICTCRPYLIHGVEQCARAAQNGDVGVIVYNRKEGRALGEVIKFLVYNARKRQKQGDLASTYFERTECVAGVEDARFQQLMPDVVHWLGITRIDRFVSMSNSKRQALVMQGIEVIEQVPIPDELIPADAQVEISAKRAAGYFSHEAATLSNRSDIVGRDLENH